MAVHIISKFVKTRYKGEGGFMEVCKNIIIEHIIQALVCEKYITKEEAHKMREVLRTS